MGWGGGEGLDEGLLPAPPPHVFGSGGIYSKAQTKSEW